MSSECTAGATLEPPFVINRHELHRHYPNREPRSVHFQDEGLSLFSSRVFVQLIHSSLHPLVVNLPLVNFDSDIAEYSWSRCVAIFRGGKKKSALAIDSAYECTVSTNTNTWARKLREKISKTQESARSIYIVPVTKRAILRLYALLYRWSHRSPNQSDSWHARRSGHSLLMHWYYTTRWLWWRQRRVFTAAIYLFQRDKNVIW